MSDGWGMPRSQGARDDLRDAVLGIRSYGLRFMAALKHAAPPVSQATPPRRVSDDSLFVLGLIAVCLRLDRLFATLPLAPKTAAPEAVAVRPGELLR